MAKRYLSIDEAAEILGIAKDELNRLREKGEIRGFADRGTFKFKADDVEELARRLEPSSDPEVPMLVDDDASVFDEPSSDLADAPSFIRNLAGQQEAPGSGVLDEFIPDGGSSDSDVRLVMDERLDAQHDSGPDVMLQFDESDSDVRLAPDSGPNLLADSDSDVRLLADKGSKLKLSDSDSDVRLTADLPTTPSDSVLKMQFSDSDSDVRLDGGSGIRSFAEPDSDSDVMLAPSSSGVGPKPDSDSDVMLVSQDSDEDSDSDVHLDFEDDGVPIGPQSDSDVQLLATDSDSDVRMLDQSQIRGRSSVIQKDQGSDSDVAVLPEDGGSGVLGSGSGVLSGVRSGVRSSDSSVLLEDSEISIGEDSGISLTGKSGISLEDGGSGIALEKVSDSGLSLEHPEADSGLSLFEEGDDDSEGITLAEEDVDSGLSLDMDEDEDSGIALEIEADSGIALQSEDEGSDISLDLEEDDGLTMDLLPASDSGIALKDDDVDLQLTETLPTLKMSGEKDSHMTDTMLEVPALESDDEEEAKESDFEIGTADAGSQADTSVLLFDDEDESDDAGQAMVKRKKEETDEEAETFDFDEEAEEEEEPAAEEIDGDVFAGDEAFDEDAEAGESASDYEVAPVRVAAAGAVEYPWGVGTVVSVGISAVTMLLCAMASIELVRSMWGWQAYSPANGWLIDLLGGLLK